MYMMTHRCEVGLEKKGTWEWNNPNDLVFKNSGVYITFIYKKLQGLIFLLKFKM